MRCLLAAVLALTAVPAAFACINDREIQTHEREFKSQYNIDAPMPQPTVSPEPTDNVPRFAAGGAALLLVGAAVVTLRRPRD